LALEGWACHQKSPQYSKLALIFYIAGEKSRLTLNTEGISGDTPSLQEPSIKDFIWGMYEASLSNTDRPYEILYTWLLKAGRVTRNPLSIQSDTPSLQEPSIKDFIWAICIR
jgi:hypothetical protein